MSRDQCGSTTGYRDHMREGSETCTPCRAARAAWQRGYLNRRIRNGMERLTVPAVGTQRRLRALAVMGWSFAEIGRRLGISGSCITTLVKEPEWVYPETAEKIAALFEELCMVPGESKVARTRALRKGWVPPLAWDDIDDPGEVPAGVRR